MKTLNRFQTPRTISHYEIINFKIIFSFLGIIGFLAPQPVLAQEVDFLNSPSEHVFYDINETELLQLSRNTFKLSTVSDASGKQKIKFEGTWPSECAQGANFKTTKNPVNGTLTLKMQVNEICMGTLKKSTSSWVPLSTNIIEGTRTLEPLELLVIDNPNFQNSCDCQTNQKNPVKKLDLDMSAIRKAILSKYSEEKNKIENLNKPSPQQVRTNPFEIEIAKVLKRISQENPDKVYQFQTNIRSALGEIKNSQGNILVGGLLDKTGNLLNEILTESPENATGTIDDWIYHHKKEKNKKFLTVRQRNSDSEIVLNADPIFSQLRKKIPALGEIIDRIDISHIKKTSISDNGVSISPGSNTKLTIAPESQGGIKTEIDYSDCDPSMGAQLGGGPPQNCNSSKTVSGTLETELSDKLYLGTKGEVSMSGKKDNSDKIQVNDKQIGIYIRYNH